MPNAVQETSAAATERLTPREMAKQKEGTARAYRRTETKIGVTRAITI